MSDPTHHVTIEVGAWGPVPAFSFQAGAHQGRENESYHQPCAAHMRQPFPSPRTALEMKSEHAAVPGRTEACREWPCIRPVPMRPTGAYAYLASAASVPTHRRRGAYRSGSEDTATSAPVALRSPLTAMGPEIGVRQRRTGPGATRQGHNRGQRQGQGTRLGQANPHQRNSKDQPGPAWQRPASSVPPPAAENAKQHHPTGADTAGPETTSHTPHDPESTSDVPQAQAG